VVVFAGQGGCARSMELASGPQPRLADRAGPETGLGAPTADRRAAIDIAEPDGMGRNCPMRAVGERLAGPRWRFTPTCQQDRARPTSCTDRGAGPNWPADYDLGSAGARR